MNNLNHEHETNVKLEEESILDDLYQLIILEHYKHPRNFNILQQCNCKKGKNPNCSDDIQICLEIENNLIKNVGFDGVGCALSIASSSILLEQLKGSATSKAHSIIQQFITAMIDGQNKDTTELLSDKLRLLLKARNYPLRVKCVLLSARTIEQLLQEHRR